MSEPPAGLPDGTYDVFVVDVTIEDDPGGDPAQRLVHLELTVLAGEHKGEVLTVAARGLPGEEFDLIGMPGTLAVADGRPSVRLER